MEFWKILRSVWQLMLQFISHEYPLFLSLTSNSTRGSQIRVPFGGISTLLAFLSLK